MKIMDRVPALHNALSYLLEQNQKDGLKWARKIRLEWLGHTASVKAASGEFKMPTQEQKTKQKQENTGIISILFYIILFTF